MIYIVEDDANIRELVVYMLNKSDLNTTGFGRPSEFWAACRNDKPELILLDIMLPEEDGLSILGKLRDDKTYSDIPVMMLTAKDSEYDKVLGLDKGADDYLAKPFGMMELVARVRALLRRNAHRLEDAEELEAGNVKVIPSRHDVIVDGRKTELTLKEFELLHILMANRGMVFTRDDLLSKIWGYSFAGESRTVDVHIRTLRKKLGAEGNIVETVRGVGYKVRD